MSRSRQNVSCLTVNKSLEIELQAKIILSSQQNTKYAKKSQLKALCFMMQSLPSNRKKPSMNNELISFYQLNSQRNDSCSALVYSR